MLVMLSLRIETKKTLRHAINQLKQLAWLNALTWRWTPQTRYTLRRNTASIIKGLVFGKSVFGKSSFERLLNGVTSLLGSSGSYPCISLVGATQFLRNGCARSSTGPNWRVNLPFRLRIALPNWCGKILVLTLLLPFLAAGQDTEAWLNLP